MKNLILILMAFSLHAFGACHYDETKLLSLDLKSFDQDPDGGWRELAKDAECQSAAADLLQKYRNSNAPEDTTLYWHEGQLRASMGEIDRAIPLFEQSKHPADTDITGWNYYVEASIAFLKKDKKALNRYRDLLASVKKPEELNITDARGNPVAIEWPPNLNVVDSLVSCFNKSYKEAYAGCQQ
ncbi:hypothetical protein [Microbulbifer sp. SAOS-129_SWC]|uniref:hypothetical protein n=1 Tax=Microbulbifer sp. SAOS-129_SWC TaxID=3145235 RepID=UPI0032172162